MKTFWVIIFILFTLATFFTIIILASLYVHKNMKGTKIYQFVNKHIIADEDDYIK